MEKNSTKEEPSTAQYAVVVKVDVERLRRTRLEEFGDELTAENLDDAVCQELGWAAPSGVNTDSLELMEDLGDKTPHLAWIVCRYDGFENTEKRVFLVDKGVEPKQAAEVFAAGFEVGEEPRFDEETRVYSFASGKDVWVDEVRQISEVEYHILKKYL